MLCNVSHLCDQVLGALVDLVARYVRQCLKPSVIALSVLQDSVLLIDSSIDTRVTISPLYAFELVNVWTPNELKPSTSGHMLDLVAIPHKTRVAANRLGDEGTTRMIRQTSQVQGE